MRIQHILMLLLVSMMLCCITACGGDSAAQNESSSASQTPQKDNSDNDHDIDNSSRDDSSEDETSGGDSPDFAETLLFENDACLMKVIGIDTEDFWGYTLDVCIENKTADKIVRFSLDNVAVNGIMCSPAWEDTLEPNTNAMKEVTFSRFKFEEYGIADVFEITGTYRVRDDDDWMADDIINGEFALYPQGEAYAETAVQPISAEGEVLFETDSCKMIVTGYDPDNVWGYAVKVYLENKTDLPLMFVIDDAAVNGYDLDPYWSKSVLAGKRAFSDITWSDRKFAENDITDVESVTIHVRVYTTENLEEENLIEGSYTLYP